MNQTLQKRLILWCRRSGKSRCQFHGGPEKSVVGQFAGYLMEDAMRGEFYFPAGINQSARSVVTAPIAVT